MNYAHIRSDGTKQTLDDHLNQVSEKTAELANKIKLQKLGEIAGLLHDYGKINPDFQKYLLSAAGEILPNNIDYIDFIKMKGKIDHSTAGAQLVDELSEIPKEIRDIINLIIVSHHGGLLDYISPDGEQPLIKRLNKDIGLNKLKDQTESLFLDKLQNILSDEELSNEFDKHVTLLKRGSNSSTIMYMIGMTIKFLYSCLIDSDRSNTIEFENPNRERLNESFEWDKVFDAIETKSKSFVIRNQVDEYRKNISDACFRSADHPKGIYQLTVPTGGGKTLSSLRFAVSHLIKHKMDRIIYIIPYTSIIDQNAETVRSLLKSKGLEDILLEHHSNLSDEEDTEKNRVYAENWDSKIIYTTMVQFLETLFSGGTSSARRLHNLANAVIIFDEVQTIGIKNIFLFNCALKYLHEICGSTILLCTATQPVLDSIHLAPYNITLSQPSDISIGISELEGVFDRVEPIDWTMKTEWRIADTAELAMNEHDKGQSVLVIVNTKAAAREVARIFEKASYDYYHLSTSMCPNHRLGVLSSLREQLDSIQKGVSQKPVLCISTQLVEAGVDIDFNVVIRHVAGLDSVVQAAGRCNRNGLMQTKGKLYVVNPSDEQVDKLKDIKEGKRITDKVLRMLKSSDGNYSLLSSRAIELYFQEYYYARKSEMFYPVKLTEFGVEDSLFNLLSRNERSCTALARSGSSVKITFPHGFKIAGRYFQAIDSLTKGVIVPYCEGKDIIIRLCASRSEIEIFDLLRKAQRFSINLYDYQVKALFAEGAIHETQANSGVYYLEDNYYSEKYGLDMEGRKEEFLLY